MTTSNASKTVNYTELFTHKTLTKCIGEPTYATIKLIETQCKANVQRFTTPLGGGNHKYLGLVLSPEKYALLSDIPFVKPPLPQPLSIPTGTSAVAAASLRDEHEEAKRLFHECEGIESAVKQQLLNAFDYDYLADLIDRNTQSFNAAIHEIFAHLYKTYGQVTIAEFHEQRQHLEDAVLDLAVPLTVFFNKIEDLQELSEHIHAPITEMQCIHLALRKLIQTQVFAEEIKKWNKASEKTWTTFKLHFRTAQQDLRDLGGLQLKDTAFKANLVQEVLDGVQTLLDTNSTSNGITHNANLTVQNPSPNVPAAQIDPHLFQQFQMFMQMRQQSNPKPNDNGPQNNAQAQRNNSSRRPVRYCWTHGACGHSSAFCRNPAQGHVSEATFSNRFNGNNARCRGSGNSNTTSTTSTATSTAQPSSSST